MNRQQAEHILDAYTDMHRECGDDDVCVKSLREVILDAMTQYKTVSNPWTITYPPKPLVTYTAKEYPANWDGTPNVTCTGIDPMFKQQTTDVCR